MSMHDATTPEEVHALAGQLLVFVRENFANSDLVISASLKCAAATIDETRNAHLGAQLHAGLLNQYRGKK